MTAARDPGATPRESDRPRRQDETLVVGRGARPEVLVPAGTSPRVTAALGSQLPAGDLGMAVTEAPSALATRLRRRGTHRIPLAHPVVVALELARDEARGREILEGFAPVGVARVWA